MCRKGLWKFGESPLNMCGRLSASPGQILHWSAGGNSETQRALVSPGQILRMLEVEVLAPAAQRQLGGKPQSCAVV